MIKGTCDFYSLQMYSTRLVTKKDPSNDAKLMVEMKEKIKRAPDIELPGHELDTLLYWFRPGWYGDMQVWTALDQECLNYFVLFLTNNVFRRNGNEQNQSGFEIHHGDFAE